MDLQEWSKQFELGMKDADRAPNVPCPCCGQAMCKEIGWGKITGYMCMGGCQFSGRRVAIEQIVNAEEWRLIQEEAIIRKETFEEMRKRNGAHDRERDNFESLGKAFQQIHGITHDELIQRLLNQKSPIATEWRKFLAEKSDCYCTDCHGYHPPTIEHPLCRFCSSGFVHAPMPEDIHFDYRGWKFTPPFICMGCGIEVCYRQWAFSRSCGACDVSNSKTRRLTFHKCFAGPHEILSEHRRERTDIPEDHFVDPVERNKYAVEKLSPIRKLRVFPLKRGEK